MAAFGHGVSIRVGSGAGRPHGEFVEAAGISQVGVGALGRYWIRNRGRVQGPYTEERIQGLLRRGRFSRSFHVSEDKKEWLPASEFPELFAGIGRSSSVDDDDSPFQSGGSPFEDDDAAPTKVRSGGSATRSRRARPEPEEDDDEDWEDDDGSDDEDWDDDSPGVLTGAVNWIEANVKSIVALLVLALVVAGWFVFGRESFVQDAEDLETLVAVKTRINAAHAMGVQANEWNQLSVKTTDELAPMVARLEKQASSLDHVKQELLFVARDDVPRLFKELPKGEKSADRVITGRFAIIQEMIKDQVRQHPDSALSVIPQTRQPPQQQPAADGNSQTAGEASAEENGNATTPQTTSPTSSDPAGSLPAGQMSPPAAPNGSSPVPPNSAAPGTKPVPANPAPANGIPGRPQAAQF